MDNLDSRIRVIESKPYDSPGTGRRLWVRLAGPSAAPKPTNGLITGSIYEEVDTGRIYRYDESMQTWHKSIGNGVAPKAGEFWRVSELNGSNLAAETIIEYIGIPPYVEDMTQYEAFGLTESGWYVFARITAEYGTTVTSETTVTGAAGYIATEGDDHVDVAVRFDVAALSQEVTIDWGTSQETYVFKATDLGIRNLDYRTTFYVYDADKFVSWEYALTTDATFVADKAYYVKDENDAYTLAIVTTGEAVAADTYYNHSKCIISGLPRNVTYRLGTVVDCPMEFILPVVEDETHGCWYEIRCVHAGEYSMTLTPPSADIKVGTEHTQKETKGLNSIVLHYNHIDNTKVWRFLHTHTSIPE